MLKARAAAGDVELAEAFVSRRGPPSGARRGARTSWPTCRRCDVASRQLSRPSTPAASSSWGGWAARYRVLGAAAADGAWRVGHHRAIPDDAAGPRAARDLGLRRPRRRARPVRCLCLPAHAGAPAAAAQPAGARTCSQSRRRTCAGWGARSACGSIRRSWASAGGSVPRRATAAREAVLPSAAERRGQAGAGPGPAHPGGCPGSPHAARLHRSRRGLRHLQALSSG